MWWFARPEDAEVPDGLPPGYAVFQTKEGWFFVCGWPGNIKGERKRDGPYPEREDARYWAWRDAGWEK